MSTTSAGAGGAVEAPGRKPDTGLGVAVTIAMVSPRDGERRSENVSLATVAVESRARITIMPEHALDALAVHPV